MAASKPKAIFNDDEYRFEFEAEGITFQIERISDAHGDMKCELVVLDGSGILKPRASINFLAERTVTGLAKDLASRTDGQSLDWVAMVTTVSTNTIDRFRAGEPPVALVGVSAFRDRPRYLLWPFIGATGDTVLFAHGGTGKSMFALFLATSIATGLGLLGDSHIPAARCNVLYLDWEADEIDHAERLHAILAGYDPPIQLPSEDAILYKRMRASLIDAVSEVRAIVVRHNIGVVIVDSIGKARGGNPNDPEETLKLFNALRKIGAPSLIIDHMSKASLATPDGGNTMPIGTIYTHNSARLTWGMSAPDVAEDPDFGSAYSVASVMLSNFKNNNGRPHKRLGFDIAYCNDANERLEAVYVTPFEAGTRKGFMAGMHLWEKCRLMIQEQGPATSKMLAAWLNARAGEVDRVLLGRPQDFWRDDGYWHAPPAAGNVEAETAPAAATAQTELPWYGD